MRLDADPQASVRVAHRERLVAYLHQLDRAHDAVVSERFELSDEAVW
ncbi:MAG TPA: hypothetical protein VFY45_13235 [Baekduia sp.]|nr:hypothetical protein [Baekduia sp.]